MNKKNSLFIFCVVVFAAFFGMLNAMDFKTTFINNISGKDGHTVHVFINSKLKGSPDAQVAELCAHMDAEGHFGVRQAPMTKDAVRSMPKRWSTFFIKPDKTLYGAGERLGCVARIWNSEKLYQIPFWIIQTTCEVHTVPVAAQSAMANQRWDLVLVYSGDVPSPTSLIVQLDGLVDGICGIAFGEASAPRPCFVRGGDNAVYNEENRMALRLVTLGRDPVREDF
jgi:hypothetical protein